MTAVLDENDIDRMCMIGRMLNIVAVINIITLISMNTLREKLLLFIGPSS